MSSLQSIHSLHARAATLAFITMAASSPTFASTLSANVALTSDYVWRGSSQSQGDAAVQAGMRSSSDTGWYGAVWGSSVEFAAETEASAEFDLALGWSGALGDGWILDVNLTHYRYPATTVDLDWTEVIGMLTWKDRYWAQLGMSNDVLGSDEHGTYVQIGARIPFAERFRIETALGHYALDDAYGESYRHAQLGVVWVVRPPLELRLSAHDTSTSAQRLFPGLAGSRVEAAVQATF